jgi:hypothetical protein
MLAPGLRSFRRGVGDQIMTPARRAGIAATVSPGGAIALAARSGRIVNCEYLPTVGAQQWISV